MSTNESSNTPNLLLNCLLFVQSGTAFLIYAPIIYPALRYWLGHGYPAALTFGLPCPTAIFTFGMLLWTDRRVPLYLLPIPFAWSLIGMSAGTSLGMVEDYGLLVAGLLGSSLVGEGRAIRLLSAIGITDLFHLR